MKWVNKGNGDSCIASMGDAMKKHSRPLVSVGARTQWTSDQKREGRGSARAEGDQL